MTYVIVVTTTVAAAYLLRGYELARSGVHPPQAGSIAAFLAFVQEVLCTAVCFAACPARALAPLKLGSGSSHRPVVVLADPTVGWPSGIVLGLRLARRNRRVTLASCPWSYLTARDEIASINTVLSAAATHSQDGRVDVLAFGIAGLAVREDLVDPDHQVIGNFVTLGTPHGGTAAAFAYSGSKAKRLRPGSRLLGRLGESPPWPKEHHACVIRSSFDAAVFPPELGYWKGAFDVQLDWIGHHTLLFSARVFSMILENLDYRPQPPASPDEPVALADDSAPPSPLEEDPA